MFALTSIPKSNIRSRPAVIVKNLTKKILDLKVDKGTFK